MTVWLIANMAPIMFASLVVILLIGYPAAFSLAFIGIFFGFVGIQLGLFHANMFQELPDRVMTVISNETLLAIPFFTYMGLVLERSGMAEELLDTIGQLFGPVRGGLAYAVIFVGALLAATTGVVSASVIAMGLISLPIMLRYGYSRPMASGVIAASGTLAQIIPPSLVLIVLADQLGRSVGDMYNGAIIPGLVLSAIYALYIFGRSLLQPDSAPALPLEARKLRGSKLLLRVIISLVPPLILIFLVLGTIFIGLATPTEGGAMGAVGAMALAAIKGRLNFTLIKQAVEATTKLSTFVMFILIGSRVFSLTFYFASGNVWVENLLLNLPGGAVGFLIVVNLFVFALAFFLDFFEIAFIVVPLLGPAAEKLGIDLVWFGILLGINMQTAFMHPPFGFSLFYLRSVAPKEPYIDRITGKLTRPVTTGQIYWGALPFVVIQAIMIALTIAFPQMVLRYRTALPTTPVEIHIQAPTFGGSSSSGPDFGGPNFGSGGGSGTPAGPNFGTPSPAPSPAPAGPNFGAPAPAPSPAPAGPNFGNP
jgi:tripartite ATP-independent transporter DctM subunit